MMATSKKRFGQNFLTDKRVADKIVDAAGIEPGDEVLEIGPGKGILTERILDAGANLTAVEIDRDLIPGLMERFGDSRRFNLLENDIIKIELASLNKSDLKIVGNLPYNISGALMEWLIENHRMIRLALITVQKEVADRIRAGPGGRDYGSLSVLIQMFFAVSRLFDISPGSFFPKPKVKSTVIKLVPDLKLDSDIGYDSFKRFIYTCFARKRKTLVNSLKSSGDYDKDAIEKSLVSLGKSTDIRAEQVSGREFSILYRKIAGNAKIC
ncbi:MAG: ribosomal RNA small subunit methyltransferase A [Candidatus Zixiibacteriota bacterium]|nr:MAG: ribosomal RNA small subunit methyltransferase A [candidate division Zixibacteria bacterium]